GFSSRKHMHFYLLLGGGLGLGRRGLELFRQSLKLVIGRLVSQVTLLYPALFPARRAHAKEALALHPFQHLDALSVMYHTALVVERGHVITQAGLGHGDVSIFRAVRAACAAAADKRA